VSAFDDEGLQYESQSLSALLQQSCSILTEERLFPDSGYMLSTA